nr:hypothetical protein 6 [bacterium]
MAISYSRATSLVTAEANHGTFSFEDWYDADQAGTLALLSAAAPGSAVTLTYDVQAGCEGALQLDFVVANKTTEADYIFVTGKDVDGSTVITESLDVSAGNGTYTTTRFFSSVTNIDCSDNANGGGTVWADGTLTVNQNIWGTLTKPKGVGADDKVYVLTPKNTLIWWNGCTLADTNFTLIIPEGGYATGKDILLSRTSSSHCNLGLIDEDEKYGYDGGAIIVYDHVDILKTQNASAKIKCGGLAVINISGSRKGNWYPSTNSGNRHYNCMFEGLSIGLVCGGDVNNVDFIDCTVALAFGAAMTGGNVNFVRCDTLFSPGGMWNTVKINGGTISDVNKLANFGSTSGANLHLRNFVGIPETPTIQWNASVHTDIYEEYDHVVAFRDENDALFDDEVTYTMDDKDGTEVFSETSASGVVDRTADDGDPVVYRHFEPSGTTTYYPFDVTAQASGYEDKVAKCGTVDRRQAEDWEWKLTPLSVYPSEDDVRDGTKFGPDDVYEGNVVIPAAVDLRTGKGAGTNGTEVAGSLDVPAKNKVVYPEATDDGVGAYHPLAEAYAKYNEYYGEDGTGRRGLLEFFFGEPIECNVTEEQIAAVVTEELISGAVTEEQIAGAVTEEIIQGEVVEELIEIEVQ